MTIKTTDGKCHFCGKKVSADDYCYGCKKYVCEECEDYDSYDRPAGLHRVEDHKGGN